MEQNVRTLSVIFATLALIASVLVMPNVSATDGDLQTAISGDEGVASYASAFGLASFSAAISSTSGDSHTNVVVSAAFAEGSGWVADQATISDCSGEGTTGSNNTGDLAAGETNNVCIVVSVQESGSEAGDDAYMTISVTSDEDSTGTSTEVRIIVSDWRVYSNDEAKAYDEGDTNSYTISVQNIKKVYNEATGETESAALEDDVTIELSNAGEGWNIDSVNSAWDKLNLEATISYIAADGTFDLVLDIQLVGGIIPASSYIGSNSNIVFTTFDAAGVYALVSLEATVQDNFALNSIGSGNEYIDNGCDSDDTVSIGWTPSIQNFGNTLDSFTVTFDTSDAGAEGWLVDSADNFNTGNLLPKFEEGNYDFSVGLHVPGGLPAGTSHGFSMTIISDSDSSQTQTQTFSATVNQCYGLTLAVDETSANANPGSSVDFSVTVTNTGNGEDTMEFQTMGAAEWAPTLSESSSTLASGASAPFIFTLTVPSDASANAQSGMAMVHAYSEACGADKTDCEFEEHVSVSVKANQVYDITAGYYTNETDVVKSSASVQEGVSVQMKFTLTNNGNGNDEVALSLENAPSWVVLGTDSDLSLIGPGQTATLTIDVLAPSSDALGDHTFQVTATSADGETTSTTGDLTVTVVEKTTTGTGPETDKVDEDDSPGFGILSVIAALGAVLLLRRRS
ncbi:MAG TPA: PGF-CTERM sorting domain-containing protein [Candidatus Poseidoniia archaeon]|jgi:PGF-CTERM protein|nr:PGF-CTERM sorting domain-containing protein [Candidatus Poseidoniia archaeon]|tara:strand:+ start:2913 stop:4958 length:2046 start_codon:yes stop_codon:yes gene_type:complete